MARNVKGTRRYESPRRREQAAETRREILGAAQRLFESRGYAATTMTAVAAEAGVAVRTVYLAFETKSGLLRALWHLLLRDDDAAVPMGERAWYRDLLDAPDAAEQVRLLARTSRVVKERAATLMEVIRTAAATDPDAAALWERIQSEFHRLHRPIVESIAGKGALRDGLDEARAADVAWALNHPNLWQLLVVDRGWTPEAYERWLERAIGVELLAPRR